MVVGYSVVGEFSVLTVYFFCVGVCVGVDVVLINRFLLVFLVFLVFLMFGRQLEIFTLLMCSTRNVLQIQLSKK